MSLWSRIREWFGSESAQTRPTGGVADPEAPDTHSTTGTTPNDTFVGRVSGDDPGHLDDAADRRTDEPPRPEGESPSEQTDPEMPAGRPSEQTRRAQGDDPASGGS